MNASILAMLAVLLQGGMTLYVSGDAYRLESPPSAAVRASDTAISRDRDKTALLLNHQNDTWYERTGKPATSRFFSPAPFGKPDVRDVKVTASEEPSDESIAGHPSKKHVIRLSYTVVLDYSGTTVRVMIGSTAIVNTATDLPPLPRYEGIVTSFPEIDAKIAGIYASFGGMVLKQVISVSQQYEGGPARHEVVDYEVERIETKADDATLFEVPQGFVHQFPQLGMPGGSPKP